MTINVFFLWILVFFLFFQFKKKYVENKGKIWVMIVAPSLQDLWYKDKEKHFSLTSYCKFYGEKIITQKDKWQDKTWD